MSEDSSSEKGAEVVLKDVQAQKKKTNVSGIYGVHLDPFRRLRTVVWMREVLRVAGCGPSAIAGIYKNNPPVVFTPEQDASLTDEQKLDLIDYAKEKFIAEAKELIASIPLLADNKAKFPAGAELSLYLAGLREPTVGTVKAIATFKPKLMDDAVPLEGTDSEFSLGPYGYRLWRVLNGDLSTCQEVIKGELLQMGQRFFKRNDFRWGVGFSVQINLFYKLLTDDPILKGLKDQDDVYALGIADTTYETQAKAVLAGEVENPVRIAFEAAMNDESDPETAIDTWAAYFVAVIAFWQRSMISGLDGLGMATIMTTGFLTGPLDKLYGISGQEIREFAIGKIVESMKSLGTDEKPSARYMRLKNYLEPYLSQ